jgi:hypothetical protein
MTALVNGKATLVGVTSWGYGCADSRYPGKDLRIGLIKNLLLCIFHNLHILQLTVDGNNNTLDKTAPRFLRRGSWY